MTCRRWVFPTLIAWAALVSPVPALEDDFTKNAQAYRKPGQAVKPSSESTVIAEAEEFFVHPAKNQGADDPRSEGSNGWRARPFGTNYFAATFANSFLSRKAYLGAPEQCPDCHATIEVQIPKAGKYLALVRYEAAFRFESQFRLTVEQQGQKKLDRLYGARDNLRIWAFREKLKKEVGWPWGAVENVVWEGHDAFVDLQSGVAKLTLSAGKQPELAARRNVDLVMLTSDLEQVKNRIEKENYLPLDGMLTQTGDVHLKVHNKGATDLKITVPHCTEHSPYWVHIRDWKPRVIDVKAGVSSAWTEVGGLLDTLSDGQWTIQAAGKNLAFDLEFARQDAAGNPQPLARFNNQTGNVSLAFDGDTRYSQRLRLQDDVLYDLVAYLKKHPESGKAPQRTLIYGYTFSPKPGDAKYNAALDEFLKLTGGTALGKDQVENLTDGGLIRGYIDVRGVPTPKLEEHCKKLVADKRADKIAVVSLGDEIGLGAPAGKPDKINGDFHAWLKSRGLKPSDVEPSAGADWSKVQFQPKLDPANPQRYYWSKIYSFRYGIREIKERTDILRKYLPNAGIGANFSPHHNHLYLGETFHWISVFREDGMTMPWGEDYIWQVPVGSQQMCFLMHDMFRCGIAGKANAKLHFYVMPHTPGNTTSSWRRLFYGSLGHGANIINLFEYRPVQVAYTENHTSHPAMYQEVRKSLHELGLFEDIIQDGKPIPAKTGLWFSETADVWQDHDSPFDSGLRTLYVALRQLHLPLDCVVEGDDLKRFDTLVLTDRHVSGKASQAIADWVKAGGNLVTTAEAGTRDEYDRPNKIMLELMGLQDGGQVQASKEPIKFDKQDLPFAKALTQVKTDEGEFGVYGLRTLVKPAKNAKVIAATKDGTPALIHTPVGKGQAWHFTFQPGLSYFQPAIPQKPVDRGSTDDSMAHFIPTKFDQGVRAMLAKAVGGHGPVTCSNHLVESAPILAKQGVVVPLINWSSTPIKGLTVDVTFATADMTAQLASSRPVRGEASKTGMRYVLDLDVADALILRRK